MLLRLPMETRLLDRSETGREASAPLRCVLSVEKLDWTPTPGEVRRLADLRCRDDDHETWWLIGRRSMTSWCAMVLLLLLLPLVPLSLPLGPLSLPLGS